MIANDYKGISDSVHYKSENVQKFLKVIRSKAEEGYYWMPRYPSDLPLTNDECQYLKSQGFHITSEVVSWYYA